MNFQNKNSTGSATTTTSSNSTSPNSKSYPKLIDEVNNYWLYELNEIDKIKNDIKILERMFTDYNNDSTFLDCKEILLSLLENKQSILNNLEEQFYVMKRNFNIQ